MVRRSDPEQVAGSVPPALDRVKEGIVDSDVGRGDQQDSLAGPQQRVDRLGEDSGLAGPGRSPHQMNAASEASRVRGVLPGNQPTDVFGGARRWDEPARSQLMSETGVVQLGDAFAELDEQVIGRLLGPPQLWLLDLGELGRADPYRLAVLGRLQDGVRRCRFGPGPPCSRSDST